MDRYSAAMIGKGKARPWAKPKPAWHHPRRSPVYQEARWRRFSKLFKKEHPMCITPGCGRSTYYTDHVINLNEYDGDPYDQTNMQPLCKRCGQRKTGQEGARARNRPGRGV